MKKLVFAVLVSTFFLVGCSPSDEAALTLATTTSTDDSGLLDELLPIFEEETGHQVDVIAVGTGQALEIGRRGDADILLVHAKELEKEFVENGYGTERFTVMYNDYIFLGPVEDVANVKDSSNVDEGLSKIYQAGQNNETNFNSRGDNSGTHNKEKSLWEYYDFNAEGKNWYNSLGQGMGDTLIASNEMGAYTLTDRGTFLSMKDKLENLQIVLEGDDLLHNPYGIIPVNPNKFSNVNSEAAQELVEFFIREDIQDMIGEYGIENFGQPLFFPNAY
ncbi:substrate-binding domain-containing protein [Proteinivorax tanatarense]|uniref:Substrate-binding domain-containing protein n=1 Tax=Proteinivorax tanatarense TaxID=1260629 RepID=A0AAU7VJL0_9FIRM